MPRSNERRETKRRQKAAMKMDSVDQVTMGKIGRFQEVLSIAREKGLLKGTRTELIRGRMPKALVAKAKARSGVESDTKLIEIALANLAVADEYPTWLLSQQGSISKDLDLEF
jgi:hypothetical protein